MNRYGSRKFLAFLAVLGSATALVYVRAISDTSYVTLVCTAITGYFAANVGQKAALKSTGAQ